MNSANEARRQYDGQGTTESNLVYRRTLFLRYCLHQGVILTLSKTMVQVPKRGLSQM